MDTPRISIIVPVYRVENYLEECIRSVLSQSFQEFELILIDDGSPDRSGEICDEFAKSDNRVRVIHKNNEGLSLTRNKGIEVAKGDYILFLDSDDTLEASALFDAMALADTLSLDVAVQSVTRLFLNGEKKPLFPQKIKTHESITGVEYFCNSMEDGSYNTMAQVYFIRRQFLLDNQIIFYPGIVHEDILFSFQLLTKAKRVGVLERPTYIYRYLPGSMANTVNQKRYDSLVFLKKEFESFLHNATDKRLKRATRFRLFGILNIQLKIDRKKTIPRWAFFLQYFRLSIGSFRFLKMAVRGFISDITSARQG